MRHVRVMIHLAVLIEHRLVTDGQTDTEPEHTTLAGCRVVMMILANWHILPRVFLSSIEATAQSNNACNSEYNNQIFVVH